MKKKILAPTVLALSLLVLSGCASGSLPDYNILGSLRVLALQADTPEVDPSGGPTVTITPVISDINLGGRPLSYSSVGCIDPGIGYGATPSCANVPGATTLTPGSIPLSSLNPTSNTFTGVAPTVSVQIPTNILATANAINQFNGVAYLVIYTLTATNSDGSTSQVVSFKRIIASIASKTPKNKNPSISTLNSNSGTVLSYLTALTFPVPSGTTTFLSPTFDPNSVETYPQLNNDGSTSLITETLTTTWFVSDGSTTFYRTEGTDTNTWAPPATKPNGSNGAPRGIAIVAVTRDGHGGEAFSIAIQ